MKKIKLFKTNSGFTPYNPNAPTLKFRMKEFLKNINKEPRRLLGRGYAGFTLVELIFAVAIFLGVLTIVIPIFSNSVKSQRQDFLIQNLQDNARYILEAISKEVRMSAISGSGQSRNLQIAIPTGNVTYQFNPGQHTIRRNDGGAGGPQDINSSQVRVDGWFYILSGANQQPRVTIVMRVYPSGASTPEIRVENTVTSRAY